MNLPRAAFIATSCALLLASASAAPASSSGSGGEDAAEFLADGPFHRVIVPAAGDAMKNLRSLGAVRWSEDYGGFVLAYVDTRRTGGVAGLRGAAAGDEAAPAAADTKK
jgi:hypothetical protein